LEAQSPPTGVEIIASGALPRAPFPSKTHASSPKRNAKQDRLRSLQHTEEEAWQDVCG